MTFLLSPEGMAYNAPALLALGLLVWKRPGIGLFMVVLAGLRVGAPVLGFPMGVPFSMHAALAAATTIAWSRDDRWGNALLLVVGLGLLAFTYAAVGWLLPGTEAVLEEVRKGVAAGLLMGSVRAVACGGHYLWQSAFQTVPHGEDLET